MIKLKKKILIIVLVTFFIDQFIKFLAIKYLTNVTIIPGFLSLVFAKNKGVAFSLLWGNRWAIIALSILLLSFLIHVLSKEYLSKKENDNFKNVTFGLLIGGIIGNLFDRIFRGYVIDYVSLNIFGYAFPIFNLADVCISFSVILLLISSIKEEKENKNKKVNICL